MLDFIIQYLPHVFLFICILGIIVLIRNIILGLWSYRWESVTAKVLEASLEPHSSTDTARDKYTPFVKYQYFYKGNKYIGEKYSYMPQSLLEKEVANYVISRYLINENITIKVNSHYPAMSVIEHGIELFVFVILVVVICFGTATANYLYPNFLKYLITLFSRFII